MLTFFFLLYMYITRFSIIGYILVYNAMADYKAVCFRSR
jgi:hypothetical protein